MGLNVKVGLIGPLDMLKFKNMAKVREKAIQSAPAEEIKADFAVNKNAKILHPDFQKLIVDEIINHEGADAKTFVFRREDRKPVAYFRAGQYISLKFQVGTSFVSRPYTISSSPKEALEGKISVTIRSVKDGFASDWLLENLKTGDSITASDAQGQFYYEPLRDCEEVVALAGGSGITPFLSMAKAVSEGTENFNLTVIFGSRTEESILFRKELDELCACCSKIKVIHVLSDEDKDGFESGFITADLIKKYAGEKFSLFICGPEAMYRFLDNEIKKLNLPSRLVRREMMGVTKKIWEQPEYPSEIKGRNFNITIRQGANETVISASADEPVLTAIERAGIKAPSRCRSGECSWCRSKLISGDVFIPNENDGRRWADIQNGYIHPCSAFALSDMIIEVPGEYLG